MQYGHVRAISRSVGAITVRSSGIQPCGDVVVLARTATGWQRINLENGSVTFCRRTRRGKRRRALRDRRQHDRHASHTGPQQSQRTDHVPLTPLRDADGNAGLRPGGPVRRAAGGGRPSLPFRFHQAAPRRGAYEGRSRFRSSDLPREPRRGWSGPRDQQLSSADTLVAADIPSPAADRPVVAERQKQARDRRRAGLLSWTTSDRLYLRLANARFAGRSGSPPSPIRDAWVSSVAGASLPAPETLVFTDQELIAPAVAQAASARRTGSRNRRAGAVPRAGCGPASAIRAGAGREASQAPHRPRSPPRGAAP